MRTPDVLTEELYIQNARFEIEVSPVTRERACAKSGAIQAPPFSLLFRGEDPFHLGFDSQT